MTEETANASAGGCVLCGTTTGNRRTSSRGAHWLCFPCFDTNVFFSALVESRARVAELERAIESWKREEVIIAERETALVARVSELERIEIVLRSTLLVLRNHSSMSINQIEIIDAILKG